MCVFACALYILRVAHVRVLVCMCEIRTCAPQRLRSVQHSPSSCRRSLHLLRLRNRFSLRRRKGARLCRLLRVIDGSCCHRDQGLHLVSEKVSDAPVKSVSFREFHTIQHACLAAVSMHRSDWTRPLRHPLASNVLDRLIQSELWLLPARIRNQQ